MDEQKESVFGHGAEAQGMDDERMEGNALSLCYSYHKNSILKALRSLEYSLERVPQEQLRALAPEYRKEVEDLVKHGFGLLDIVEEWEESVRQSLKRERQENLMEVARLRDENEFLRCQLRGILREARHASTRTDITMA